MQVGLPSYAEMTEAVLDYKLRAAGYNVRGFVTSALENREDGTDLAAGEESCRDRFACRWKLHITATLMWNPCSKQTSPLAALWLVCLTAPHMRW